MIVRCSDCNAAYSVEDKKIENKKFGFSCPKCGASVIIDNRHRHEEPGLDLPLAGSYQEQQPKGFKEDTLSAGEGDFPAGAMDGTAGTDDDFLMDEDAGAMESAAPAGDDALDSLDDIDAMLDAGEAEAESGEDAEIDMSALEDVLDDVLEEETDESVDEPPTDDEPLIVDDFEEGLNLDEVELAEHKAASGEFLAEGEDDEPLSLEDFESGIEEEVSRDDKTSLDEKDIIAELDDIDIPELESGKAPRVSGAGESAPLDDDIDFDQIIMEEEPVLAGKAVSSRGRASAYEAGDSSVMDSLSGDDIKSDEVFSRAAADSDESTTIDLDSLDIELEETEGIVSHGLDETPDFEIDEISDDERAGGDEDMDTTIDLDSLDITLEEEEELKRGIELDDEERLNLGDAGLSLDQLADEGPAGGSRDVAGQGAIEEEEEEEDIKLSIEEIAPGLSVDDLAGSVTTEEHLITEDFGTERLPEIDIEGLSDADVEVYRPPVEDDEERLTSLVDEKPIGTGADDYLDIESREEFARYQSELEGEERGLGDVVPGGSVNFSVDYSLSYSRLGAFLRLIMVYTIGLLPRLAVALVYALASWVASVFNWLLILLTGESQEDYSEMQEKTLRAVVSLAACASGIVEEMPSFTGRKNIDYPLQLTIIYPVRYSRVFAFLRISIVGMVLIMLPHLLLLTLLSLGALLIYIAGMISVLATRKWPTLLFDFMSRYYGYLSGVLAFMTGLVDRYPSFRFD